MVLQGSMVSQLWAKCAQFWQVQINYFLAYVLSFSAV